MDLPETETLLLALRDGVLHVTLNRPERRNALSARMVEELIATFGVVAGEDTLRAIVLRGAGGTFCAGADVKDMAAAPSGESKPGDRKQAIVRNNRRFGALMMAVNDAVVPVIAVVEGAVMGG